MFIKVLKHILLVLVINSENSFATDEEKQKRVDILNELLNSSGWKRIGHVKARYENVLISGKDVSNDFDLNVEYSENLKVSVENFNTKYNMTIRLLACVYTNQMIKVISALTNILTISAHERRKARDRAYDKLTNRKKGRNRKRSVDEKKKSGIECDNNVSTRRKVNHQRRLNISKKELELLSDRDKKYLQAYKESIDCQKAWEIFHFVLRTLKSASQMFKYINSAMSYLLDLMPFKESTDVYTQKEVKLRIVDCAVEFENASNNINVVLPDCIDKYYFNGLHRDITAVSTHLLKWCNRHLKHDLKLFVEENCVPSKTDIPSIEEFRNKFKNKFPGKEKSDIIYYFGNKIDKFKRDFIDNYYSNLGFIYDEKMHTTYVHNT